MAFESCTCLTNSPVSRRDPCNGPTAGSEPLDPRPQLDLPRPGAAVLPEQMKVRAGNSVRIEHGVGCIGRLLPTGVPDRAIDHDVGHVDTFGASSRAMLCARPRRANLPIAKGAEPGYPFTLADAPVKRIAPWPARSIRLAAACATRKPP